MILPVPTVAPRAVAAPQKAFLSLKIFPKVFLIIKPILKIGKNPLAKVIKKPVPKTRAKRAGPQIISESFSVLTTSFSKKSYADSEKDITKNAF